MGEPNLLRYRKIGQNLSLGFSKYRLLNSAEWTLTRFTPPVRLAFESCDERVRMTTPSALQEIFQFRFALRDFLLEHASVAVHSFVRNVGPSPPATPTICALALGLEVGSFVISPTDRIPPWIHGIWRLEAH